MCCPPPWVFTRVLLSPPPLLLLLLSSLFLWVSRLARSCPFLTAVGWPRIRFESPLLPHPGSILATSHPTPTQSRPAESGQPGRRKTALPPSAMDDASEAGLWIPVMTLRLYWTCHTSSQRRNTGRATEVPASLPRPFRSSLSRGGTVDVLVDAHNSTSSSQSPQPPLAAQIPATVCPYCVAA